MSTRTGWTASDFIEGPLLFPDIFPSEMSLQRCGLRTTWTKMMSIKTWKRPWSAMKRLLDCSVTWLSISLLGGGFRIVQTLQTLERWSPTDSHGQAGVASVGSDRVTRPDSPKNTCSCLDCTIPLIVLHPIFSLSQQANWLHLTTIGQVS